MSSVIHLLVIFFSGCILFSRSWAGLEEQQFSHLECGVSSQVYYFKYICLTDQRSKWASPVMWVRLILHVLWDDTLRGTWHHSCDIPGKMCILIKRKYHINSYQGKVYKTARVNSSKRLRSWKIKKGWRIIPDCRPERHQKYMWHIILDWSRNRREQFPLHIRATGDIWMG